FVAAAGLVAHLAPDPRPDVADLAVRQFDGGAGGADAPPAPQGRPAPPGGPPAARGRFPAPPRLPLRPPAGPGAPARAEIVAIAPVTGDDHATDPGIAGRACRLGVRDRRRGPGRVHPAL